MATLSIQYDHTVTRRRRVPPRLPFLLNQALGAAPIEMPDLDPVKVRYGLDWPKQIANVPRSRSVY